MGSLSWFGGPIVGCFIFLSGYGLAVSFNKKGNDYLQCFFSKRIAKLLPWFIILSAVAIFLRHWLYDLSFKEIFQNLVFKGIPPLASSWFVYAILILYCGFYLCARIYKTPIHTGIALTIFTLVYMFFFWFVGFGWISAAPAFPLGYFAALHQKRMTTILRRFPILINISIILFMIASVILAEYRHDIFQPMESAIIPVAVYIILLAIKLPPNRILIFLGTISWEIFLMQGLMFTLKWPISAEYGLIIIFTGAIAGGGLLWHLSQRFFYGSRNLPRAQYYK